MLLVDAGADSRCNFFSVKEDDFTYDTVRMYIKHKIVNMVIAGQHRTLFLRRGAVPCFQLGIFCPEVLQVQWSSFDPGFKWSAYSMLGKFLMSSTWLRELSDACAYVPPVDWNSFLGINHLHGDRMIDAVSFSGDCVSNLPNLSVCI